MLIIFETISPLAVAEHLRTSRRRVYFGGAISLFFWVKSLTL